MLQTLHLCALELLPWLNSYLQLTLMPNDRFRLTIWCVYVRVRMRLRLYVCTAIYTPASTHTLV